MKEQKKCPACGTAVPENATVCETCGLKGLDLVFLCREDYKKWEEEVLRPHREAITPKLFAGKRHGLILTAWGDLYGIGNNQANQLTDAEQELYDQPVLVARDVISAAAGQGYSAYVTRDGQLHWQCVQAEYMPAFSNVRAVYAECWRERFWVALRSGEVWCFGNNYDELLEQRTKTVAHQFPEMSGVKHGFNPPIYWMDDDSTSWNATERCVNSETYRSILEKYGEKNVELDENRQEPNKALKALYFTFQKELVMYRPTVYVLNNWIYDPVPFTKAWREDLPHRIYGRPVTEEEFLEGGWSETAGVKEISAEARPQLRLSEDGKLELCSGKKLEWLEKNVLDMAQGFDMILLACADGEILWADSSFFDESAWAKMYRGEMNTCRLPKRN